MSYPILYLKLKSKTTLDIFLFFKKKNPFLIYIKETVKCLRKEITH